MLRAVKHTVLVKVLGGNKAQLVHGHPCMWDKVTVFNHTKFGPVAIGKQISATFSVTPKRRYLLGIREWETSLTVEEFQANYSSTLAKQAEAHAKVAREDWGIETITPPTAAFTRPSEPVFEMNSSPFPVEAPKAAVPNVLPKGKSVKAVWQDGVYLDHDAMKVFGTALALANAGETVNVLMVGPSGYGKTTIPEKVARTNGMDVIRMNCAAVRDPEEWFGYREAVDGSTVFVPTEFTKTIIGGNAIVILDEFNRVEPWLTNTLYPLLDDARSTLVHGERITCGENLIFVATINQGFEFTGTFALDAALTNRFDMIVHVSALPQDIEEEVLITRTGVTPVTAKVIVSINNALRLMVMDGKIDIDPSTRTSIKIAKMVSGGIMSLKDAFKFVVMNSAQDGIREINDVINIELSKVNP